MGFFRSQSKNNNGSDRKSATGVKKSGAGVKKNGATTTRNYV